jgi:hypothetical protein
MGGNTTKKMSVLAATRRSGIDNMPRIALMLRLALLCFSCES